MDRSAAAALPLALLLGACTTDLALPDAVQVSCTAGTPCPERFECSEVVGRCVPVTGGDEELPALVSDSVSITPLVAKVDARIRVDFEVTELLAFEPEVVFDVGDGRPLALLGQEERRYAFTYTPAGTEPQNEAVPLTAMLIDQTGNIAPAVALGNVRFDFVPPVVSGIRSVGRNQLKRSAQGVVELTVDEALPEPPSATISETGAVLAVEGDGTGPTYRLTYTVTDADAAGPVGIEVLAVDAAGNEGRARADDVFVLDFAPPEVRDLTAPGGALRAGDVVSVLLTLSEPPAVEPAVTMTRGEDSLELERVVLSPVLYSFLHVVVEEDHGSWELTLGQLLDVAGNAADSTDIGIVEVDTERPGLVGAAVELVDGGFRREGQEAQVAFTTTEPVQEPSVVLELGGGLRAPLVLETEAAADPGTRFVFSFVVQPDHPEGGGHVYVTLEDLVGNRGGPWTAGPVTIDLTPPELSGTPFFSRCDNRQLAREAANDLWVDHWLGPELDPRAGCGAGDRFVDVAFAVNEPTDLHRLPRVVVGETALSLREGFPGETYFVYGLTPTGEEPETDSTDDAAGGRAVRATVWDHAGNTADLRLGTLRFDFAPPVLRDDELTLSKIVHVRSPWGSEASAYARSTLVELGPDSFSEPGQVQVWTVSDPLPEDGDPEGALYARSLVGSATFSPGLAQTVEAGSGDVPVVVLTFSDRAGNESDATPGRGGIQGVPARAVEWTATLFGRAVGDTISNPHSLARVYSAARCPLRLDGSCFGPPPELSPVGVARLGDQRFAIASSSSAPWWQARLGASPQGAYGVAAAYDARGDRFVVFGGTRGLNETTDETWEWDGARWERRFPTTVPPRRAGHALAYDGARGRVVMFGGRGAAVGECGSDDSLFCSDTWEWDGHDWVERQTPTAPSARSTHGMAYDEVRRRTVLFGGWRYPDRDTRSADTWEWDGRVWARLDPPSAPPARNGHAMAYDAVREVVVLFGGDGRRERYGDTWTWDGEAWARAAVAHSPEPRSNAAMFFDHARAEVVLFGGHELAEGSIGDTWTFDGVDWVQHVPAAAPPDRVAAALAYGSDDGEALLFGGYYLSPEGLTTRDDTWVWDGDTWTQEVPAADPRGTEQARMAREPASDRMLLFPAGAFDHPACGPDAERSTCHTWIWDGQTWNGQLTAVEPPVRAGHAVATDGVRGVLLFGGVVGNARDGFEHLDDTWMWRDGGWHELHPEHHPSGRSGAATVGMPARQSVLLFGGSAESPGSCGNPASAECSDTWEWDGSDWREHDPVTVPHARAWHALAWDTGRRRAVLFGGFGDANGCGADGEFGCSDTWEWDGSDWSLCASAVVPEVRMGPAMVYDAARARVVLFGGIAPDSWTLRDTWEWNGLTWVEQHPLLSAPSRYGAALEYDPARHEAVLYGGEGGRGIAGTCGAEEGSALCRTTWTYAPAEASSHLVVAFDLRSSATIEPSVTDRSAKLVHSVHVRAAAGGLGHTRATGSADGERVPGYRVSVSAFGYGGWVELHRSGDATPDALEDWTGAFGDDWSCGEPWCEDVTIDEWMGADGKLHFDFAPLAPQGASPENGEVALDYVELRVRYWRTGCEPPYELNPEGTPDGTPCTDGKPETVGETCCRFECVVGDCEESPPR